MESKFERWQQATGESEHMAEFVLHPPHRNSVSALELS